MANFRWAEHFPGSVGTVSLCGSLSDCALSIESDVLRETPVVPSIPVLFHILLSEIQVQLYRACLGLYITQLWVAESA